MNIIHLPIIDSTNDEAQRRISLNREATDDFVIRADFQTDGRGQRGNTWHSENAVNLMFSYVFHPKDLEVTDQFLLSQAASAAVAEYLNANNIPQVSVKWPNDIYSGMKKICGMLIENSVMGKYIRTSIIGIGINVNQRIFPENLPNPVSMANISHQVYNLDTEFESITAILQKHLAQISKDNRQMLKKEYTGHLLGLGKTLIYNAKGNIFKGVVKDVDDFGHITVENVSTGESQKYDFKEIELVIPEQNKLTE